MVLYICKKFMRSGEIFENIGHDIFDRLHIPEKLDSSRALVIMGGECEDDNATIPRHPRTVKVFNEVINSKNYKSRNFSSDLYQELKIYSQMVAQSWQVMDKIKNLGGKKPGFVIGVGRGIIPAQVAANQISVGEGGILWAIEAQEVLNVRQANRGVRIIGKFSVGDYNLGGEYKDVGYELGAEFGLTQSHCSPATIEYAAAN